MSGILLVDNVFQNNVFQSFEIWVPTNLSPQDFELEVHRATVIHTALLDLINNRMSLSEYLEFIDFLNIDIDNYLDEVEQNLESTPLIHLR
ncbi:MAG: hypothetical protein ACBR12_14375 [Microcoleus sp.]